MTSPKKKQTLHLSTLIALGSIIGCGPLQPGLCEAELEQQLMNALDESEVALESPVDGEEAQDHESEAEEQSEAQSESGSEDPNELEAVSHQQDVEDIAIIVPDYLEERESEPCEIEIVDGLEAAPGETITIQWDENSLYTSEAYIAVHSGWGAEYYLSTVAANTGSFDWTLPADLDPELDDYTVYVESAENGARTVECWAYADLEVMEPEEEVGISPIPTPIPGPATGQVGISPIPTPIPGPTRSEMVRLVQEMAAYEPCPIQGVLVGHFAEGEGLSNSRFRGKGLDSSGPVGSLKGECSQAVNGRGRCIGKVRGTEGGHGRMRSEYETLGANAMGPAGTFEGDWESMRETASEASYGNLVGVWQESAAHQKGLFVGFWSACSH